MPPRPFLLGVEALGVVALGVPGTEEAGEGTEEDAWEWEEEVPEAEEDAPSDMMEVRPEESTFPTAGRRIWGNWAPVSARSQPR